MNPHQYVVNLIVRRGYAVARPLLTFKLDTGSEIWVGSNGRARHHLDESKHLDESEWLDRWAYFEELGRRYDLDKSVCPTRLYFLGDRIPAGMYLLSDGSYIEIDSTSKLALNLPNKVAERAIHFN